MSAGLTRDGLERFGQMAAMHVEEGGIPGLVALVARGEQVHVEVHGSLSIGGPPMRRDTLFRIASITKPVTGVATMALVAEGRLGLDEPVARLLPELASPRVLTRGDGPLDDTVPADGPITVRQLLAFTFGFGLAVEMFMSPEPWPVVAAAARLRLSTIGPPDPGATPDPDTWMASLGSLPLLAQPGTRWLYNTGASVLGVLCARAAGTSFPEVLRTRVLEPLGMRDTGFWTEDTNRLATAYAPEGVQVADAPDGRWSRPPAFPDGAGGLLSTADDLLALGRMMLRGEPVLSAVAVAEMTRDQLTPDQRAAGAAILGDRSWGLCLSVVTHGPRRGAFGWNGASGTSWLVDPGHDLVVLVLTQRQFPTAQPPRVHRDLQDAAYAAVA